MSVEISKFLSLVLRHDPGKLGIDLDANGWTSVDDLIAKMRAVRFPQFDRAMLEAVVAGSEKKRFTFSADGTLMRAAQGHSVSVDLAIQPTTPPEVLFHGTAVKNLTSIREQGLLPGKRQHVHLSRDHDTAASVGQRHGRPVVLTVDAGKMSAAGILFYQADNGVWLTDAVPREYVGEESTNSDGGENQTASGSEG